MDIKAVGNRYSMQYAMSQNTNSIKSKNTNHEEGTKGSGDVVSISSRASFRKQFADEIKAYKAEYNNSVSSERLDALKEQYSGTNCPVSANDIAHAMMSRVVGI